jgi:excisionase family DNA binding protein
MLNKKTKQILSLTLEHIQKTNEALAAIITTLNEDLEEAIENHLPVTINEKPLKAILNVAETAEYCGYSKSYLYQLIHRNEIPYLKPLNGRIFFKRKDIDDFIARRKHDAGYEVQDKAAAILNGEAQS